MNNSNNKINDNNSNIEAIHAQFKNDIVEIPCSIALDHACKSMLIATRDSWSLEDCVIDEMPYPTSLKKVAL